MEYVTRVQLDVNGKTITDFKTFTIKEEEYYKQIPLMNKTGHAAVTTRHGCSVDYVKPVTNPEIDWSTVRDGRLTVEYESGARTTFTGVYCLKKGEEKVDGENEVVIPIDLGAEGKVEE